VDKVFVAADFLQVFWRSRYISDERHRMAGPQVPYPVQIRLADEPRQYGHRHHDDQSERADDRVAQSAFAVADAYHAGLGLEGPRCTLISGFRGR